MATGMITRHFDHPSGATATLEMPAGWSRNSYYVMTVRRTNGEHGVAPERVTCSTPEEARQRAIERERAALANGWRPRTTVAAKPQRANRFVDIHLPDGRKLPLGVRNVQERPEQPDILAPVNTPLRAYMVRPRSFEIDAAVLPGHGAPPERPRRILINSMFDGVSRVAAGFVQEWNISVDSGVLIGIAIRAVATELEPGEETAIERFHSREQVILDLLDDPDPSIIHLYIEISKRVQEPADRPQVQQEILRRRAELQAAEIREREAAVSRERAAAEEAVRRTLPTRPRQQSTPPIQQDVQAAMRRLAGGQDLGAPKRRKIDLG